MNIKKGESIVIAWAESYSGPGWSNQLVRVIIRSLDGGLREEAFQPQEQTNEMRVLFSISQAAASSMIHAVETRGDK